MNCGIPSAILASALLSIPAAGIGQIIENAAGPAAKNAGRVIEVEEVWRITDDGGEFYFQHPGNFQVAGDGSIFLADRGQILRFSPDGKFLKNVLRVGEGPGEIKGQGAQPEIIVHGNDLYVFDGHTFRCWRDDLDGRLVEEFEIPRSRWPSLVGVVKEGILSWRTDWQGFGSPGPHPSGGTGRFIDVPEMLTLVTRAPGTPKDLFTVTRKIFVSPRVAQPEHLFSALSPDGQSLYFALGEDYLVQVLDLASGAVVRRFRRPYQRVPTVEPKPMTGPYAKEFEEDQKKGWYPPRPPFVPDIQGLRVVGDRLWVSTSTRDKAKGSLIDVFDRDGRYVDCFWTGRRWGAAFADFVLGTETRDDDTIVLVKSRILN